MIIIKRFTSILITPFICLSIVNAQAPAPAAPIEKPPINKQAKKELPDFSTIFPDIKLTTKGKMSNGMRYGYQTDIELDDIIKRLKKSLGEGWEFRQVTGKELEQTTTEMKKSGAELLGLYSLTNPDFPRSEVGVGLVKPPNKEAKNMLSIITNTSPETMTGEIPKEAPQHLKAQLIFDEEILKKTYADQVRLMPGHEALKPKYGIAEDAGRKNAADVSAKTIITFLKGMSEKKPRPPARVLKILKVLEYKNLKVEPGDYTIAPSDPVKTPDGNLHFNIIKGDKLIQINLPGKDDYILLQMRLIKEKWRVVAEYID